MRAALWAGLHLAVLWGLAVAQSLFDLLGENAEFFAVRDSTRWDLVVFALGLVLVPPALLLLLEALAGLLERRLRLGVHLVAVAGLVGLLALQAARRGPELPVAVVLTGAALTGVAAGLAYVRLSPVRSFLTLLAPVPLVFAGLFLLSSPVSRLVLEAEPEPRAVAVPSQTPVVLLVFDEISTTSLLGEDGRIDARRYPSFAALAERSTWFRNAATVDAWTVNAVPAILTGRYPEHGRLPVFSEHPDNLFTLLGGSSRLLVSESLTHLCPRRLCPDAGGRSFPERMDSLLSDAGLVYLHLTLPHDLRRGLPSVSGTWGEFLASSHERTRRRLSLFADFVASLDGKEGATLAYAHLMFPHLPWEFLPSGRRYDGGDLPGFEVNRWASDSFLVEQGYQRYLLQLGFADRLLGDVVRRLRRVGLYDRALLVVVADHGVSFHAGGRRRAFTEENLEDVVFVPLLVKRPGQAAGRIVDDPVETVDVLPTIAGELGVRVPWRLDGKSLFGPRARERFHLVGDRATFAPRPAALEARREEALRRQLELFGGGLYGIGPNPELLGKGLRDLSVLARGDASASLEQAAELRSVDLDSEELPARLTGAISGEGTFGRSLAVTLAGRVAAVARSYSSGGEERFSVLVPEAALREGANEVGLFWVRPGPVLVPLLAQ